LPQQIGVAVDLAGCPNRCRHCWLGNGPNGRLGRRVLTEAAEAFWSYTRPGQDGPYFTQVDVSSSYRDPDFSDDFRELHELCSRLSRREARRYELLSIWRLARDQSYGPWLKQHNPPIGQITFFGAEAMTDHFHRRRGAFADNLLATQRLLELGMIPRWQVFLTKPNLGDMDGLARLIDQLELRRRVADLGSEFDVYCHIAGPEGEAWHLEDVRIEEADLARVPAELMEATRRHFGGKLTWESEGVLVGKVLAGMEIPPEQPAETWFFVNAERDVFPNCGHLDDHWRLGRLGRDSVATMMQRFESNATPGLAAMHGADRRDLARRSGRRDGRRLYAPSDLLSRWLHLHLSGQ
jgi:hypothetical protein